MNFIEKAISIISPSTAAARAANIFRLQMFNENMEKRKYDAGGQSRRTAGWWSSGSSAKSEVANAIYLLRNRSRELVRNNPNAKKAIRVIATNTVGSGIRPSIDPNVSKLQLNKLKKAWKLWAESTECDFDGMHSIYGLQKLVMMSVAESGECLVLKKVNTDITAVIPFQLQVLEADYIDLNKSYIQLKDGGKIINGIQFDKRGKKEGYWLYDIHPGDQYAPNMVSMFHSSEDVMHVFYVERPGQHRGVPFSHPIMIKLRDFDDYEDAELMKQKVASCFAAFVQDNTEITPGTDANTVMNERIQPGIIEHLPPGKEVTFANPPSKEGYADYSRQTLLQVAAGYGISYEALTGNLKDVNFSSGRMGWLEMQRQITDWQENMIIPQFCDKSWLWFMEGCAINGITKPKLPVSWTVPRREMIDPAKETEGIKTAMRNGLISYPEAIRQQGYEPEEVLAEIKEWMDKFASMGLQLDCDPRYDKGKIIPIQENPPGQE